ncbi:ABC transporter permease [Streptomyces sp. NPDC060028]|uniref:ABC transporter permease n=1 Tax=Streptomyces sp. NPDC060028 TaxID=3347041 RepID=UPI0036A83D50
MSRAWLCFGTAVRFAVLEQLRNRLALVLVVFFIPVWLTLAYTVSAKAPVPFFLRAADRTITVEGNILIQLTGAMHTLALIIGFMMFLATSQSADFDRRLVMAGYPQLCLVLAKYATLLLTAAPVALYATFWIRLFWQPEQLGLLAGALFVGALIYGGAGVMLAAVLRSELAGMFLIIMVSFLDVGLQNPIANPAAGSPVLRFLPTYGAMQSAATAARLGVLPWSYLAMGLCWALAMAAVGMTSFAVRNRRRFPGNGSATRLAVLMPPAPGALMKGRPTP